MNSIIKKTLSNGVRIIVDPVPTVRSAAIGLWCRTGSRNELDHEAGITHLIEHMLFKGTRTRTAKQIAESIEGRGGVLNAFTDKESTCYYARTLSDDAANAIETLSDMMLNSLMDEEELAREEQVVIEEIKRGEDEPSDQVHELHVSGRWGDHPLGKPIIGTRESVASFNREHILAYMDRQYRAENVLLSVSGNVDPDAIFALAEQYLGDIASGAIISKPLDRPTGSAQLQELSKDTEQVHFCIGTDGVSLYDDRIHTQGILDSALGGSMSSRLFQEIRERRGLAYAIGSYSIAYTAGGSFTVYGGTSPEHWLSVQELVRQEFDQVAKNGLEAAELERIKNSMRGNIVLALEGMNARMSRMSRNELFHGREVPIEEHLEKLERVTNDNIVDLANELLNEDVVSTTAIGPF